MACLCVLSFLTYFDRSFITRIQGVIQHDLAISDTRMGLIFSAFWLAYALFELPGGWLGDRFGAARHSPASSSPGRCSPRSQDRLSGSFRC